MHTIDISGLRKKERSVMRRIRTRLMRLGCTEYKSDTTVTFIMDPSIKKAECIVARIYMPSDIYCVDSQCKKLCMEIHNILAKAKHSSSKVILHTNARIHVSG